MDPAELLTFELSQAERRLLSCGLREWGGPARCTEEMAVAMGFASVEDISAQSDRLRAAVEAGGSLTRFDWLRVLLATEVVFASNTVGAGRDWPIVTGMSDSESLEVLRSVQKKMTRDVRGLIGHGFGTRLRDG